MDGILMQVDHYFGSMKTGLKNGLNKMLSDRSAIGNDVVGIVLTLVMVVVVGAIGVFVADTTVTATGTPSNANLSAMRTNILGAGETGSDFIIILIIASIGGLAIMYMFGMLGKRS